MAVDAGDLEEAVEGLVEEGVDDGQGELDVADVPGTVVRGLGGGCRWLEYRQLREEEKGTGCLTTLDT